MKILKWILLIFFCPVTLPVFLIRKFVGLKSMGGNQATNNIEIINNDISDFVVIDFETTGLNPVDDRIVEIVAVKMEDGQITEYSTLVNPKIIIPEEITAVIGITNEMVIEMPDIDTAIDGLINFIGELPIAAYNAHFHMSFFTENIDKEINNKVIDIHQLCRDNLGLKSYTLDSVCEHLGIKGNSYHGAAFNDCYSTVKLFLEIKNRFKIHPMNCVQI